ncbi:RNA polymerase sigma factor [Amycolatopsis magusensis]|uniref:RNA polymerase sigma factor n=1 Tax=Amycolatopsis magusensis TaxID=882444 RepID=UPI0037B1D14D
MPDPLPVTHELHSHRAHAQQARQGNPDALGEQRPEGTTRQLNLEEHHARFGEFVRDTYLRLFKYVVAQVRDHHLAEDLVQETYLSLWKVWPQKCTEIENNIGYSYKALKNKIVSHYRLWHVIRVYVSDEEVDDYLGTNGEDLSVDPPVCVEIEDIRVAMQQLPQRQREVIEMAVMGDRKIAEVANELGISAKTASQYKYLGMESLRKILGL